jgi:hypothetical protein
MNPVSQRLLSQQLICPQFFREDPRPDQESLEKEITRYLNYLN